jgi:drug/metabolite transporter (DMT)-like permease
MRTAAFLLAALAYTFLAAGLVLMKKGIGWFGRRAPRDAAWKRDLGVWTAGFLVSNAYIVPVALALRTLPPHIVAAFAGVGVVVMVLLSRAWLGEKLRRSDAVYAAAMGLAIGFLSLSAKTGAGGAGSAFRLAVAAVLPFLLLTGAFFGKVAGRHRAVLLAAVAGISTGMIVVLMRILVQAFGTRVGDYFGSPYFYLYIVFSLLAFLALQFAYKLDSLLRTGPVQYAASILYPALCSVLVFGNPVRPVQAAAILVIVMAAVGILRGIRS